MRIIFGSKDKLSSREEREALQKEYNEWRMKYDARKTAYDSQYKHWETAADNWEAQFKSAIYDKFDCENIANLKIIISNYYTDNTLRFEFLYDASGQSSFSWRYEITLYSENEAANRQRRGLNELEVNSKCSWSTRNLAEISELNELETSIKLIKQIASTDWKEFLMQYRVNIPLFQRYVGIRHPDQDEEYKDPGFNTKFLILELKNIIGKDVWIRILNNSYHSHVYNYIKILDVKNQVIQGKHTTEIKYIIICEEDYTPQLLLDKVTAYVVNDEYPSRPNTDEYGHFVSYNDIKYPLDLITDSELLERLEELVQQQ